MLRDSRDVSGLWSQELRDTPPHSSRQLRIFQEFSPNFRYRFIDNTFTHHSIFSSIHVSYVEMLCIQKRIWCWEMTIVDSAGTNEEQSFASFRCTSTFLWQNKTRFYSEANMCISVVNVPYYLLSDMLGAVQFLHPASSLPSLVRNFLIIHPRWE